MSRADPAWTDDVLRFWFDELAPKEWWGGAVDARVRARFAALHERLARDPPDASTLDARGHVAAVVVFDQFPRHLFRGDARAFATDGLALALAADAVDRGLDRALDRRSRHFLYMPFMHGEEAAMQARSLALFEGLGDADALRSAREHRDAIVRFGRFPYRNAALGRESTEAERVFLTGLPRRQ